MQNLFLFLFFLSFSSIGCFTFSYAFLNTKGQWKFFYENIDNLAVLKENLLLRINCLIIGSKLMLGLFQVLADISLTNVYGSRINRHTLG